MSINKLKDLS
ncbi:uncharacterized protein FFM5_15051 [Fusarium fujikuroi]|nr:uncharacterized protein FFM5_15051 [Fusarium fujikuroi]